MHESATGTQCDSSAAAPRPGHVAEFLETNTIEPSPPRRVNLLWAFCIHGLYPVHAPQLAAGPMIHALMACVSALVVSAGVLAMWRHAFLKWMSSRDWEWIPWDEAPSLVKDLHIEGWKWLTTPLIIMAVLFVVGCICVPVVAVGDTLRNATRRSINNALWSATLLPWLLLILGAARLWSDLRAGPLNEFESGFDIWMLSDSRVLVYVGILAVIGIVRCAFAVQAAYVGPAKGPGFQLLRPKCESCGYWLQGLPLASNCPECGRSVADSLFTRHRSRLAVLASQVDGARPRSYFRFWLALYETRDAMKQLPVRTAQTAHRFWRLGYWYVVIVSIAILGPLASFDCIGTFESFELIPLGVLGVLIAAPVLHTIVTFLVFVAGRVVLGIRDPRIAASVASYADVMMGPVAATLLLEGILIWLAVVWSHDVQMALIESVWVEVVLAIPAVVALLFFVGWCVRIVTGLRDARFANA